MKFHTLAVYSFKLKDENKTYKNMVEVFERLVECFNGMNGSFRTDDKAQISYRISLKNGDHHELAGIVETGHYGTADPIVNVETGAQNYEKKVNEADMEPHYFLLRSKGLNRNSGFLVFERIGNDGIQTILETIIRSCSGSAVIETEPVLTKDYVKQKLDHLKDIKLYKFIPSEDLTSEIRQDIEGDGLYLELRIRPEKNKLLSPLFKRHLRMLLENPQSKGIFTVANDVIRSTSKDKEIEKKFSDLDFDFVTATVQLGGTERRVKMLNHGASMRPYFELPDSTSFDEKGWPKFEDRNIFASALVKDILKDYGIES
jgi:hypothetical protein